MREDDPARIESLIEDLACPEARVRVAAARGLRETSRRARPAVPALSRALQDDDPHVRYLAADALSEIGPEAPHAVPDLIRALRDPYPRIRCLAADALGQIGPEARAAVPALAGLLADHDEDVRAFAARALGEIGPEGRMAVPALTRALKDKHLGNREVVVEALRRIAPESAPETPIPKGPKEAGVNFWRAMLEAWRGSRREPGPELDWETPEARTVEETIERGRAYRKNPRYSNNVVGERLAHWAWGLLEGAEGALPFAERSRPFQDAMMAYSQGAVAHGERALFGEGDGGLYGALMDGGYDEVASRLKAGYPRALAEAREIVRWSTARR